MPRLPRNSGIAIGPILFVVALLGVLAAFFASDMGSMGSASREDTITALLTSQTNLIRSKFNECNMIRGSWPTSNSEGTLVSDVTCPGDPPGQDNLWTGVRVNQLPQPPQRFNQWTYYDYSSGGGGRCVRISPASASDPATRTGIRRTASKFTSQEVSYDPNSGSQSFIVWITPPSSSAGTNCIAD